MDDIYQIVRDTVWVSLPEFIRLAFAGMAGGLIGAYVNDRLTRKRDKDSGVTTEKLVLLPLIDELIVTTTNCGHLLGQARDMIWPKLHTSVSRFMVRLKDRSKDLERFDATWNTLVNTKEKEAENQQPNTSDVEFEKQKRMLLSRLEALRRVVHDT